MLRRAACLLLLFLCAAVALHAQPRNAEGLRQPRILILLDGSSSMLEPWEKVTRFAEASAIISSLIDSIYSVNAGVEFGLRVYGHQSPAQNNDCTDTRVEVGFSKNNAVQIGLRLASLHPYGVSPIAYSLKEAADNDLVDEARNAYSIILITDGGESCGGDICATVQSLINRKIYFRPYIISLVNDPQLQQQYNCLGTYLQVTHDADRPRAVGAIVDAYRPLLSMPIMAVTTDAPARTVPTVTTVTVPVLKHDRSTPQVLTTFIGNHLIPTPEPITPALRRAAMPPLPHMEKPAPAEVPMATIRKDPVIKVIPTPGIRHDSIAKVPMVKRDTVARSVRPPKRDTAKTATLRPAKPIARPIAKPAVPSKPTEMPFKLETEEDKETTLAITFTDGHGRFYATTPQLQLVDAATGKLVKQFYRTVDEAGNPDAIPAPAGTYNLLVVGRARNMLLRNVAVGEKKKNKITVTVSNGSLIFTYIGHPERPVKEFSASVKILFEPGPTVIQHCTAELTYPPGNYTIEVNTRPVTHYNTDIDFDNTTEIQMPEPGFLQVVNNAPLGNVGLFTQLGDRFVHFYDVRVTGNLEGQKVQLQPGTYEAHWVKGPATYPAKESIQRFTIKSNEVTDIELK